MCPSGAKVGIGLLAAHYKRFGIPKLDFPAPVQTHCMLSIHFSCVMSRQEGEEHKHTHKTVLCAVVWVIKSFVSDPGISCLLLTSMKLWLGNLSPYLSSLTFHSSWHVNPCIWYASEHHTFFFKRKSPGEVYLPIFPLYFIFVNMKWESGLPNLSKWAVKQTFGKGNWITL